MRTAKASKVGVEKVYSIQVERKPAGSVVLQLANDLGKELKYDAQLKEKLMQPVDLQLKDVTLDYLMEKTLKPLGLTYRITEAGLEVIEQK